MTALAQAKTDALEMLRKAVPSEVSLSVEMFSMPPNTDMGDLSFPCFALSKVQKKAPPMVAQELAASLAPKGLIVSAEVAGPYVNFRFDRAKFATAVMAEVAAAKVCYGEKSASGREILLEYAQPNTHKEIHVGHLRNFVLGHSVSLLLRAQGDDVKDLSYIGDVGAHVAKCLWALKKFHDGEETPAAKSAFYGKVYAEATAKVEEDESLKDEIAAVLRKLEARDPEWDALWQRTRQECIEEMQTVFTELGIRFDRIYYESEVEAPGKALVKKMLADGIAKEGERGALIVDLEDRGLGVFLVLKSDGSSLYSTKELALAYLKAKEYPKASVSLHIVDMRQSQYFRQFFATLGLLGFTNETKHIPYDFVTLKEGAMSSRKGNIIAYTDFRDAMVDRTIEETKQRHEEWSEDRVKGTAWAIAESAMKFGMLKQDNDKPIVFDIDAALAFEGYTGPYVQYAHARMCSILAKANMESPKLASGSDDAAEYALLRKIADLPQIIADAASLLRPSLVAQYAFELAQATSDFYRDVPVLKAEGGDLARRLAIVGTAKSALAQSLGLLGISAPKEM